MKKRSPKPLDEAFLSSILNDLRQPSKTKSVRDEEAKLRKNDPNAASRVESLKEQGAKSKEQGARAGLSMENFELRDLVYNRATKEDGAILRVYETNGAAMYEVAVPKQGDSWAAGYYISDWAEDVLEYSDNERLNASTFEGALNLDV